MESEGERKKEQSSIKGPLSIMYENKHAHEEYKTPNFRTILVYKKSLFLAWSKYNTTFFLQRGTRF